MGEGASTGPVMWSELQGPQTRGLEVCRGAGLGAAKRKKPLRCACPAPSNLGSRAPAPLTPESREEVWQFRGEGRGVAGEGEGFG